MTKAILIIMMFGKYGSGVSVTPFESMAECQAAREVFLATTGEYLNLGSWGRKDVVECREYRQ